MRRSWLAEVERVVEGGRAGADKTGCRKFLVLRHPMTLVIVQLGSL